MRHFTLLSIRRLTRPYHISLLSISLYYVEDGVPLWYVAVGEIDEWALLKFEYKTSIEDLPDRFFCPRLTILGYKFRLLFLKIER